MLNLLSAEVTANPFAVYAALRRSHPVCQAEPGGVYVISRFGDIVSILEDTERFSSSGFRLAFEPPWVGYNPGAHTMLSMDPPEHTRMRRLVSGTFSRPSVLARMEPIIHPDVERLAAQLAARGEVEFVQEFAGPVSACGIGAFLSLDRSLHSKLKRWADVKASVTPVPRSPEHKETVLKTIVEMQRYFAEVIEERRRNPGDDVISMLVQARVAGQALTDQDLDGFMHLLLAAGLETTTQLLSKSMVMMTERPDLVTRMRSEPEVISSFLDEMLRYDPPTHGLYRQAKVDVEIAGTKIPAGSYIVLLLASANRDEAQFERPDEFDVDRVVQGGIAFGHGPHFCIGMGLARLEASLALRSLLSRFSRFERVSAEIEWNHTMTVRGPARLPIRLIPA